MRHAKQVTVRHLGAARAAVGLMLLLHTALLAWGAYRHSPTMSEIGHLPAGISHWKFGRFDLYRVNPPLPRMVAALPVLFADPQYDWAGYSTDPLTRRELPLGVAFMRANGTRGFWLFTLGRWACIPFSWVGALVCYRWAQELYGLPSGLVAAALWCFSPSILGNGALMTPDVPAASLGIAAGYALWRWMRSPTWAWTLGAGGMLGASLLTKNTLLLLVPLWPLMSIAYYWPDRRTLCRRDWLGPAGKMIVALSIALWIINLGYAFDGTFSTLRDFQFQSRLLSGHSAGPEAGSVGNRFRGGPWEQLPIPLPRDYVQGIDTQKADLDGGRISYLNGQWSDTGWWYFYLYALGVKMPAGVHLLLGISLFASCRNRRGMRRDELPVVVPLLALFAFVSCHTGFTIHSRYLLPMLPFLFIVASKAAIFCNGRQLPGVFATTTAVATLWAVSSSLWVYPHSLSYFNEYVGGPRRGHLHLLDSNLAWGQDLLYLKRWYDANSQSRPLYLAAFGPLHPQLAGIDFVVPPQQGQRPWPDFEGEAWCVVDVNYLQGSTRPIPVGDRKYQPTSQNAFAYLRDRPVVECIGYSYRVFRLTSDDFDRMRTEVTPTGEAEAIDLP